MISPALSALVDQAEASLRDLLDTQPTYAAEVYDTDSDTARAASLVAVDVLAALSEAWETSVEHRLDLVTSRLLAWRRMCESSKPDRFAMPGTCVCGRRVVLKRRPWRWVMPDTNQGCDHRD